MLVRNGNNNGTEACVNNKEREFVQIMIINAFHRFGVFDPALSKSTIL